MRTIGRMGDMLAAAALAIAGAQAVAEPLPSLGAIDSASVTYGPYARIELGHASPEPGDSFWRPPGYPTDPEITFDADLDGGGYGAVAVGFDWQNGVRAEFAVTGFARADARASCASASDGTPCASHADISQASVSTRAAMLNLYYAPVDARGGNSRLQPFLVAGIGRARNEMSDWTRVNPGAVRPVRSFEGATTSGFAWSLGAGIAWELDRGRRWPVIVEASYRYFDLGTASGGTTPLPGSGGSSPVTPFSFENTGHVIAVGIRVPLRRY